jgi:hypothetical protein
LAESVPPNHAMRPTRLPPRPSQGSLPAQESATSAARVMLAASTTPYLTYDLQLSEDLIVILSLSKDDGFAKPAPFDKLRVLVALNYGCSIWQYSMNLNPEGV